MSNETVSFRKKTISYWKTNMRLFAEGKVIETEGTAVQCGRLQGDALSPLLP
jgi:hypothetical protein